MGGRNKGVRECLEWEVGGRSKRVRECSEWEGEVARNGKPEGVSTLEECYLLQSLL